MFNENVYCLTLTHKNDIEIDYNLDTGLKLGNNNNKKVLLSRSKNLGFFDIHIVGIVSSVSDQKLPHLGSARNLGLSRKIPARTHH